MKFRSSVLLLIAALCAFEAYAVDIRFSEMVADGHVGNLSITVDYKSENTNGEFVRYYPSCPDKKKDSDNDDFEERMAKCTDLTYDDDVELRISFNASLIGSQGYQTLQGDKKSELGAAVKYKVEACFGDGFTSRRKWRKPKDVIQDDKRCSRELQEKTDLVDGINTFDYKLDSDTPGAQFFVTVFIFCERVGNPSDNQYCFFDTTGPLSDLAKAKDINKRRPGSDGAALLANTDTSYPLQYKTSVPDFRTTGLVVGVIVLSICSVSMLFGYFTFERLLKKTT